LYLGKQILYLRGMGAIEGKTATFSMLEQDILFVVMKEDAVVDIPEAKENQEIATHLTNGNRYASLVDARAFATITSEAKEYSARPEAYVNVVAQAIIVSSLANRLIATFLIRFHKKNKNVEMKLFNDYDVALDWLKEKLAEDKNSKKKLSLLNF